MSILYAYICTKSTVDPYIPTATPDLRIFSRDVSDAFSALAGGYFLVGKISLFPVQRSVPFHLLCDGQEVPKVSFPELFAYLGASQGTPANPDNFVLPNYLTGLTAATTANAETVTDGTVSTPGTPPPTGTGSTAPVTSGPVESGGRKVDLSTL